jgi:hypothetical protein
MNLYYTSFNLKGKTGPSINEKNFLFELSKIGQPITIISGLTKYWYLNIIINIFRILPVIIIHRRVIKGVIIRSTPFPLDVILMQKLLPSNVKCLIKTLGSGTLLKTKNSLFKNINYIFFKHLVARNNTSIDTVSPGFQKLIMTKLNVPQHKITIIDNGVSLKEVDEIRIEQNKTKWENTKLLNICFLGNHGLKRGIYETLLLGELANSLKIPTKVKIIGPIRNQDKYYLSKKFHNIEINFIGKIPYDQVFLNIANQHIGVSWLKPNEFHTSPQKVRQMSAHNLFVISNNPNDKYLTDFNCGIVLKTWNETTLINTLSKIHAKKLVCDPNPQLLSFLSNKNKCKKRLNLICDK